MANCNGEISGCKGCASAADLDRYVESEQQRAVCGVLKRAKVDELQLEQLRAEHIGEIRPLDTLADAQRTVPGVNS